MELIKLREEIGVVHSLQETSRIHSSPSSLVGSVTELRNALKDAEEKSKVSFDSIEAKARQVNEHQKTFVQATEALKYLQDEMGGLKQALHGSLQHTMQDMPGV